jgi:uncharacterized membrane protein
MGLIVWLLTLLTGAGIGYATHLGSAPWAVGAFVVFWIFMFLIGHTSNEATK